MIKFNKDPHVQYYIEYPDENSVIVLTDPKINGLLCFYSVLSEKDSLPLQRTLFHEAQYFMLKLPRSL
jgi:hypothetical protein